LDTKELGKMIATEFKKLLKETKKESDKKEEIERAKEQERVD
jgi:hypothetical protein